LFSSKKNLPARNLTKIKKSRLITHLGELVGGGVVEAVVEGGGERNGQGAVPGIVEAEGDGGKGEAAVLADLDLGDHVVVLEVAVVLARVEEAGGEQGEHAEQVEGLRHAAARVEEARVAAQREEGAQLLAHL